LIHERSNGSPTHYQGVRHVVSEVRRFLEGVVSNKCLHMAWNYKVK